jgi:hypothetical protein
LRRPLFFIPSFDFLGFAVYLGVKQKVSGTGIELKNQLDKGRLLIKMRFGKALTLLASCSMAFAQSNLEQSEPTRTEITVGFEYRLEVNNNVGSTEDVMGNIDSDIIGALQKALPNGGTESPEELPNVKFETVKSEIFSACFTKSDQCSLVRSLIRIDYEGEKPENSVEFVTLRLVKEYLTQYSETMALVSVTYAYPSMVKTLTQFQMNIVNGRMSPTEIAVMESTFVEVFGAIVFAFEGDTDVVDAKFLYQDLFDIEDRRLEHDHHEESDNSTTTDTTTIEEESNEPLIEEFTLSTDLQIRGFCRDCTSPQFGDIVNIAIVENLPAFQLKLKLNGETAGSTYFENVTDVTFAVPELPSKLPPIEDDSIFDTKPPVVDTKIPWFLPVGLVIAIGAILGGICIIHKDKTDLEKEEFSTSEESEEGGSYGSEGEENDGEFTNGEGTYEEGTYEGLDDYQVETIAPTDDGQNSNYEVYVF